MLKPVEEALESYALLDVGLDEALDLGRVLDGFAERNRGFRKLQPFLAEIGHYHVVEVVVESSRICPETFALKSRYAHLDIRIRQHIDRILPELVKACGSLPVRSHVAVLYHIPLDFVLSNKKIGIDYRVVVHIRTAHIQHPYYFVQGSQQYRRAFLCLHLGPEPCYPFLPALTRQFCAKGDDGRLRICRSVLPELIQQVRSVHERICHRAGAFAASGLFECGPDVSDGRQGLGHTVKRHDHLTLLVRKCMFCKPFRNEHLLRNPGLVKFVSGSRQHLVRLDEVSGVGPKSRMVFGDDQISAFSRETGEPLHLLPSKARILAAVRVRSGNDKSVPAI